MTDTDAVNFLKWLGYQQDDEFPDRWAIKTGNRILVQSAESLPPWLLSPEGQEALMDRLGNKDMGAVMSFWRDDRGWIFRIEIFMTYEAIASTRHEALIKACLEVVKDDS